MLCVFSVYLFAKRFEHPSYMFIESMYLLNNKHDDVLVLSCQGV